MDPVYRDNLSAALERLRLAEKVIEEMTVVKKESNKETVGIKSILKSLLYAIVYVLMLPVKGILWLLTSGGIFIVIALMVLTFYVFLLVRMHAVSVDEGKKKEAHNIEVVKRCREECKASYDNIIAVVTSEEDGLDTCSCYSKHRKEGKVYLNPRSTNK